MKKKNIASILALIFGMWGLHRFYLGQRVRGFLYFGAWCIGMIMLIEERVPGMILPVIVGFIDAILFFVMPKEEFDDKYNAKYLYSNRFRRGGTSLEVEEPRRRSRQKTRKPTNPYKEAAMEKYQDYDIDGAIEDFRKALHINFKDPIPHYYLACCYSISEQAERALFHLDKAVDFGFTDFDRIHEGDALAFLRTDHRFEEFVKNSYQIPRYLPANEEEQMNKMEGEKAVDLLDQIAQLGALYEKGVLTPDEFQQQKQKLFSDS